MTDRIAEIRGRTEWLQQLAERGGKGTVDNIDARSLGRVAADLAFLLGEVERLEKEIIAVGWLKDDHDNAMEIGRAALERAEKAERELAEAKAFIERTAAAGRVTPDIARGNVESMRRQVDGWTAPRVCIEFVDDAELTAFLKARSAALTHTGDQE